MQFKRTVFLLCSLSIVTFSSNSAVADSFTLTDASEGQGSYWGGVITYDGVSYAGWRDVHGADNLYGVDNLSITRTATTFTAVIQGAYFASTVSEFPGDLFLSNNGWNPYAATTGDTHFASDNYLNGEQWEYVLHMNTTSGATGSINLYEVTDAGTIRMPEDIIPGDTASYRSGQEVQYIAGRSQNVLATGTWAIDASAQTLTFSLTNISLAQYGLDGILGAHWTMSCGNDVIEGSSEVPEPASMLLFGLGLAGIAGYASRKRK